MVIEFNFSFFQQLRFSFVVIDNIAIFCQLQTQLPHTITSFRVGLCVGWFVLGGPVRLLGVLGCSGGSVVNLLGIGFCRGSFCRRFVGKVLLGVMDGF